MVLKIEIKSIFGAKIEIKSIFGALLFEYKCEDNSVRKTVEKAIEKNADLRYADLRCADLRCANLRCADLRYADLRYADLRSADLRSANLSYADLSSANLSYAENFQLGFAMTRILPEGDIIGYKKVYKPDGEKTIAKILIPKDAKRSSAFGRKCRAEFADVIEIEGSETACSDHDNSFIYKVGERVKPTKDFDDNWTKECASGIHFFITRLEALNY